jgi:hypothetical protein
VTTCEARTRDKNVYDILINDFTNFAINTSLSNIIFASENLVFPIQTKVVSFSFHVQIKENVTSLSHYQSGVLITNARSK